MRFWASLQSALRNALSPTLGANTNSPVLIWALRRHAWVLRGRVATVSAQAFAAGFALTIIALLLASLARWPLLDPVLLLIVALRLGLDMVALVGSWGRLGPEFASGRWDMLRLTAQTEGGMLRAHYAAAHVRVWRPVWAAIGAQAGGLAISAVWLWTQPLTPIGSADTIGIVAALALILALELLLRASAVTAIGLALSASAPRAGTAAIFGGLALMLLWFVQTAVLLLGFTLGSIGASLLEVLGGAFASGLLLVAVPALLMMATHLFAQRAALHRLASAVAERDAAV